MDADIPTLSPEEYVEIKNEQKVEELTTQTLGLAISIGAIKGWSAANFKAFLENLMSLLDEKPGDPDTRLTKRIVKAPKNIPT